VSYVSCWNPRVIFTEEYFCGGLANYRDYLRDHRFPRVADALVKVFDLRGRTVLDCGCAVPYLVDELRRRGVDAVGFDISDYCKEKTKREGLRWFLQADARFIPFRDRSFYLVIASELVEHVPPEFEDLLLRELTRVSARFLLIRTPPMRFPDDCDQTHVNIRPHMYWVTRIEDLGFIHRDDLFEAYMRIGKKEFELFFDEFLVFERVRA